MKYDVEAARKKRIAARKEQQRRIAAGEICGFDIAWRGPCGKPVVENRRCETHAKVECTNCDRLATHECDHTGMLVCGYPLCNTCTHPHGSKRKKKQ